MSSVTSIHYNRKSRRWCAVTGNGALISQHPPGKDGRQAAEQAAIKHDDPEIYALAFCLVADLFSDRCQDLHGRIWRGAAIAAAGDVREPYRIDEPATIARVKASSAETHHQNRHYIITRHQSRYYCDCTDFANDHAPELNGHKLCKHILAVKLMKLAKRPFPTWPDTQDERDKWLADHRQRQQANGQRLTEAEMARQLEEKRQNIQRWHHNRAMQERQRQHELTYYFGDKAS